MQNNITRIIYSRHYFSYYLLLEVRSSKPGFLMLHAPRFLSSSPSSPSMFSFLHYKHIHTPQEFTTYRISRSLIFCQSGPMKLIGLPFLQNSFSRDKWNRAKYSGGRDRWSGGTLLHYTRMSECPPSDCHGGGWKFAEFIDTNSRALETGVFQIPASCLYRGFEIGSRSIHRPCVLRL